VVEEEEEEELEEEELEEEELEEEAASHFLSHGRIHLLSASHQM